LRASGGTTEVKRVIARSESDEESSEGFECFSGEAIALSGWIASLRSQ
jgi:hypothetical protein